MKRAFFISIILLAGALIGCGGMKVNIKEDYVYQPPSHRKAKYPLKAAIYGEFKSDKVIIVDEKIETVVSRELDSNKLFNAVQMNAHDKSDIRIKFVFSDYKEGKTAGLLVSYWMYQLPADLLIFRSETRQEGTEMSLNNSRSFVENLLKPAIQKMIYDIDLRLIGLSNSGNLPKKTSTKHLNLAVYSFTETPEAAYGEMAGSRMISALSGSAEITVVERSKIEEAMKEIQLQASGLTDNTKAIELGKLLNADYFVFGNVSRLGTSIMINIRVVNLTKGGIALTRDIQATNQEQIPKLIDDQANYISQYLVSLHD